MRHSAPGSPCGHHVQNVLRAAEREADRCTGKAVLALLAQRAVRRARAGPCRAILEIGDAVARAFFVGKATAAGRGTLRAAWGAFPGAAPIEKAFFAGGNIAVGIDAALETLAAAADVAAAAVGPVPLPPAPSFPTALAETTRLLALLGAGIGNAERGARGAEDEAQQGAARCVRRQGTNKGIEARGVHGGSLGTWGIECWATVGRPTAWCQSRERRRRIQGAVGDARPVAAR